MAMTNPNLMCVFDEPAMADDAINALEGAGFGADQIYYSSRPNTNDGFFASLRNLFTNNGDTNVSHDLKDLGLTSDEAEYYQQQHRAGHGIVAVQANGRDQEVLSILSSFGAHIYGTQNNMAQDADASDTNTAMANGDYGVNGGTTADTYQNNQTYNNAGAGTGAYPDQQDYSNASTGAGTFQSDPALNNAAPGAGMYQQQNDPAYNNAGTYQQQNDPAYNNAGMYQQQNDPAYNNNAATGAGTFQQQNDPAYNNADAYQQQNDPAYNNNAGTYQQQNDPAYNNNANAYQQQNDPAYNNANTYQQGNQPYTTADRGANAYQQNDPAYNNAGTYQQQNDPAYNNNAGTDAGMYQQNERDGNTYADNRVENEQRRMRARNAERENYDANRNFDNNL